MPWARTQFKWRSVFWHCLLPQDHTAITTAHCPLSLYMAQRASENSGTNNCSHPGHVQDVRIFSWHWNPMCWPKDLKSYCTPFHRSSFIFHFICGCKCTIGIHGDKKKKTTTITSMLTFFCFCTLSLKGRFLCTPIRNIYPLRWGCNFLVIICSFISLVSTTVTASTLKS